MWYGTDAPWKGRGISPLRLTGTNALGDEGNVEHVLIHSGAKPDYHRTTTTLRVSPYVWCAFDTKCCGTESSNHEGRASKGAVGHDSVTFEGGLVDFVCQVPWSPGKVPSTPAVLRCPSARWIAPFSAGVAPFSPNGTPFSGGCVPFADLQWECTPPDRGPGLGIVVIRSCWPPSA